MKEFGFRLHMYIARGVETSFRFWNFGIQNFEGNLESKKVSTWTNYDVGGGESCP